MTAGQKLAAEVLAARRSNDAAVHDRRVDGMDQDVDLVGPRGRRVLQVPG